MDKFLETHKLPKLIFKKLSKDLEQENNQYYPERKAHALMVSLLNSTIIQRLNKNSSQTLLWSQYYPDTKTRLRHRKKTIDQKTIQKKKLQQNTSNKELHHDQMGLIPKMQWFSIQKPINAIHCINNKQKSYDHINRWKKKQLTKHIFSW